jgi:NAD(P)-dependent dehydrogenase (short-subunit alcohol dehydrogenase family)
MKMSSSVAAGAHAARAAPPLVGKNVVVIGGSGNAGRRIVEASFVAGARVLAVARKPGPLAELAGAETLALDATDESAPARVFDRCDPDVLILCGGVFPPAAPLHKLSWEEFAANWESDVRMSFNFCKAALLRPMRAGSTVILVASGAALSGSPNSGGYAGAKRTQIFIANYCQKESDRLGFGLRFCALAPRIMPDTALGRHAIAGYSRYLGVAASDFVQGMADPPDATDVADAVVELIAHPDRFRENVFIVTGKGLEALPSM